MRFLLASTLGLLAALLGPAVAQAVPGDLDPSFGAGGEVITDLGGMDEHLGVAIDSQGRIVAAGGDGVGNFVLARYSPNGRLDRSFSGDGIKRTDFGGSARASSVAIDSRDRIVAAGAARSLGNRDFALARYRRNGRLDRSFSRNGTKVTDFGGGEGINSVAIDSHGRIVAFGQRGFSLRRHFLLARYTLNGRLDPSFSADGKKSGSDFGARLNQASSVAIDSRDRIVVAGATEDSLADEDFGLARYEPDGLPDASFSGDGQQRTDFGGRDEAYSVAIDSRDRVVAGGVAIGYRPNGYDFALARYQRNGILDGAFGAGGRVTTGFGVDTISDVLSVAIDSRGRIVAAGPTQRTPSGGQDFALARYQPDGLLDGSFSGDGQQQTDFGGYDRAYSVAIDSQDRIVAAGVTQASSGSQSLGLARWLG